MSFHSSIAFHLTTNHLSTQTFDVMHYKLMITKHSILRTALYLDTNGTIIQHCLDADILVQ